VCSAKLAVQDAAILAVSADQLLLACVSGSTVRIYSLPHLLSHQSDLPAHTLQMEQPLMQFSWCPDARQDTQFLALTAGRLLLHGSLASGSATIAEQVDCASWSPDGQHIAYTSASKLVVTGADWKDSAFKVDLPPPDDNRTWDGGDSVCSCQPQQCQMTCTVVACVVSSFLWQRHRACVLGRLEFPARCTVLTPAPVYAVLTCRGRRRLLRCGQRVLGWRQQHGRQRAVV
jgi:hypothetical protein